MKRAITVAAAPLINVSAYASAQNLFNEKLLQPFQYRNMGPFRMGARTSDTAVPVPRQFGS